MEAEDKPGLGGAHGHPGGSRSPHEGMEGGLPLRV